MHHICVHSRGNSCSELHISLVRSFLIKLGCFYYYSFLLFFCITQQCISSSRHHLRHLQHSDMPTCLHDLTRSSQHYFNHCLICLASQFSLHFLHDLTIAISLFVTFGFLGNFRISTLNTCVSL